MQSPHHQPHTSSPYCPTQHLAEPPTAPHLLLLPEATGLFSELLRSRKALTSLSSYQLREGILSPPPSGCPQAMRDRAVKAPVLGVLVLGALSPPNSCRSSARLVMEETWGEWDESRAGHRGTGTLRDTVEAGRRQGSEGCTSSIRDAASRRKLPKASTVPVIPPNSELSCSYKGTWEGGHSPAGEARSLRVGAFQHPTALGAHHQEPREVHLGEEGALHGTELGAGQCTQSLLQALSGVGVAPHQEAPQDRGVADQGF